MKRSMRGRGAPGGVYEGTVRRGNGGRLVFVCTGPLRPERCAGGIGGGGVEVRWGLMSGGLWGVNLKNRPSHHKYNSSKQLLRNAYLDTSELKGSKST